MFDFRRITILSGKCLSNHKITVFQKFVGGMASLHPSDCAYADAYGNMELILTLLLQPIWSTNLECVQIQISNDKRLTTSTSVFYKNSSVSLGCINPLGAIVPILEHAVWSYPGFLERRQRLLAYHRLFRDTVYLTKQSLLGFHSQAITLQGKFEFHKSLEVIRCGLDRPSKSG